VTQGEYGEADELFERALAIEEKFYGSDHPKVAADSAHWSFAFARSAISPSRWVC